MNGFVSIPARCILGCVCFLLASTLLAQGQPGANSTRPGIGKEQRAYLGSLNVTPEGNGRSASLAQTVKQAPNRHQSPLNNYDRWAEELTESVAPDAPAANKAGATGRPLVRDLEDPATNVRLKALGANWRQMNLPVRAGIGAAEDQHGFALFVSRTEVGTRCQLPPEEIQELMQEGLKRKGFPCELVKSRPHRALEINGSLYEARAKVQNQDIVLFLWCGLHRGFLYEITVASELRHRGLLNEHGPELLTRVSLIDPLATASEEGDLMEQQVSRDWGMSLNSTGTRWRQNKQQHSDLMPATLACARPQHGTLAVQCYLTLGMQLPTQLVRHTLLQLVKTADSSLNTLPETPITFCGLPGIRIDRQSANGSRSVIVITAKQANWLIVADCSPKSALKPDDAFKFVTLADPVAVPNLHLTPRATLDGQSAFWMLMGRNAVKLDLPPSVTIECLKKARELNPNDAATYVEQIVATARLGDPQEALTMIERAPAPIQNLIEVDEVLPLVLLKLQRTKDAIAVYRRLLRTRRLPASDYEKVLVLIQREEGTKAAIRWVDDVNNVDPSLDWLVVKAKLYSSDDQHDAAIDLLRNYRVKAPKADEELTFALIDVLLAADRTADAQQELDALSNAGKEDVRLWLYQGVCHLKSERFVDARTSFQKVLNKNPNHAQARSLMEIVAARAGQGDVSEVSHEIPPVPLPTELVKGPIKKPQLKDSDTAWYELDAEAIHFEPQKDHRRTLTRIVHIRNRAGIEEFRSLLFPFHPLNEQVAINRVEVFDELGEKVGTVAVSDCYVKPYSEDNLASNTKALVVPVPGLRPNCRLEVQVTYRDRQPPERFHFKKLDLLAEHPAARVLLLVTGTTEHVAFEGPSPVKTPAGLLWQLTDAPRQVREPSRDELTLAPTVVCLSDRRNSWPEEVGKYLESIHDRLVAPSTVVTLASKILAGHEQDRPEDKVNLLASWVQNQLTYQGLEFGARATVMPPVEQTLKQRFGDCKDHSLLMYQLLQAAGLKPHLALANASSPIISTLPDLEQFNHMVTVVTDDRGDRVLDLTNKYFDAKLRIPPGLAGMQVLVLDPQQVRLQPVGDFPRDASRILVNRTVKLRNDGSASIQESVTFNGYGAMAYREVFANLTPERRREYINALFLGSTQAKLRDFQLEGLNDNTQPFEVKLNYEQWDVVQEVNGALIGRLPAHFETQFFNVDSIPDRRTPFRFQQTRDITHSVKIELPIGTEIVDAPSKISKTHRFIDQVRNSATSPQQLEIQTRARRRSGLYEASEWAQLVEASMEAQQLFSPKIHLRLSAVRQAGQQVPEVKSSKKL